MSNITKAIAALGVVAGLGVAALPLSSYAVESGNVTIKAVVDSAIQIETSTDEVTITTLKPDVNEIRTSSVNVTVTGTGTNYNLNIKDSDGNTALVGVSGNAAATSASIAAAVPTGTNSAWAFRGGDSATSSWTAIKTADQALRTSASLAENAVTTVEFGVSAASGLADGTYEGGVIFTATTAQ